MEHELERRLPVGDALHELRDRDLVRSETARSVREHTGLVGHVEVRVERRAPRALRKLVELAPARVVLQEPRPRGADDADEVRDDGGRGLDAAGTRSLERDLADRIALEHHGVERAVDRGERMRALDECRLHPHVDLSVQEARDPDEPHDHAEIGGRCNVRRLDLGDAAHVDVLERDARAERDGREDRHLRRGVGAVHVVGRIRFRVAELLRFRERLGVRAALLHAREDEVRRAVDDPEHAMHVRDDERLAEHLDHRDRRAHRRLEAELHSGRRRDREQVGPLARDELLVRGHYRLAGPEQLADVSACRIKPAHHLRDDANRGVVAHGREVRREDAVGGRKRALLVRVADEGADDPQPVAGGALDLIGALDEQAVDRSADRAVAEECHPDVN